MDKTLERLLGQHVLWLSDTANTLQLNITIIEREATAKQRPWLLRLTAMVTTLKAEAARVERWIAEAAEKAT